MQPLRAALASLIPLERSAAYTWGSTAAERARAFPCDGLVPQPTDALFRAVDVAAPARVVFRWLCQLRAAPYSYDWIDNLGRQSPRRLTPGLERLAVGQRVMTFFELIAFEPDRHLTLVGRMPGPGAILGRLAASYVVVARGETNARLVVKLVVGYPQGPLGWAMRGLLPWADLAMMRKQLLTLQRLAEASAAHAGAG
jgi:hypothetical protein